MLARVHPAFKCSELSRFRRPKEEANDGPPKRVYAQQQDDSQFALQVNDGRGLVFQNATLPHPECAMTCYVPE